MVGLKQQDKIRYANFLPTNKEEEIYGNIYVSPFKKNIYAYK